MRRIQSISRTSHRSANSELDVILVEYGGPGWAPVNALASLTAELFNARLLRVNGCDYPRTIAARGLLPRVRSYSGRKCLLIAPTPGDLNASLTLPAIAMRYRTVVGWVIDSFWHDRIPRVARSGRFDYIFVTDDSDVEVWRDSCPRSQVGTLPWGADTIGIQREEKKTDVCRVGRMPKNWEDDDRIGKIACEMGITFRGRPPFGGLPSKSLANVHSAMAISKYVLAFSNLVSPATYTHPTRDYLTARWTDALAHGAVVAGVAPVSLTSQKLLWPGATLQLDHEDVGAGMATLRGAAAAWTEDVAEHNRLEARRTFDWRHRLRIIAELMQLSAHRLDEQLAILDCPHLN